MAINKADYTQLLSLCDQFRDIDLPKHGIKLEDTEDGSLVKLMTKEDLNRIELDAKSKKEKLEKKLKQKLEKEAKELEKLEKGKLSPELLFVKGSKSIEFSQFDANGLPTHDSKGEPLSQSKLKKLKKEMEQQTKLHAKYLESKQ